MTEVSDFMPFYPDMDNDKLQYEIARKEEFRELKLNNRPEIFEGTIFLKSQLIIQRLMSPYNDLNQMLIFHGLGTGKTIASVVVAESFKEFKRNPNGSYKKVLVLVKGDSLVENYRQDIAKIIGGVYIPSFAPTAEIKRLRTNNLIGSYYDIRPIKAFLNSFPKNHKTTEYKNLVSEYNDTLIIVDEAHNLRIQPAALAAAESVAGISAGTGKTLYTQMKNFLGSLKRTMRIFLTGTPMWDQSNEIASLLNLMGKGTDSVVLPEGDEFLQKFFNKQTLINEKELRDSFYGRVSYLRSSQTTVNISYKGVIEPWFNHTVVYPTTMSPFQEKSYNKISVSAFSLEARQESNFVFPDGSTGEIGCRKYTTNICTTIKSDYEKDFKLNLRKYGGKFFTAIKKITEHPDRLAYVFSIPVVGSGANLFSALLKLYGYSSARGTESVHAKRFALVTGRTNPNTNRKLIKMFNSKENREGKLCQVFIGTVKTSQGISLHRVQQIHILTPWYNEAAIEQAVARAIRFDSHTDMPIIHDSAGNIVPPKIRVYKHVSVKSRVPTSTRPTNEETIDIQMYLAGEKKDIYIQQIIRQLKIAAVDCPLTYKNNVLATDRDGSRECNYKLCNYKCGQFKPTGTDIDGINNYNVPKSDLLYDVYNQLYATNAIREIKNNIRQIFRMRFFINTEELFVLLNIYNNETILLSIDSIISEKEILHDRYGFASYLAEEGNVFYLTRTLTDFSSYVDAYYAENPFIVENSSLDSILTAKEIDEDMSRFKTKAPTSEKDIKSEIDQMNNSTKTIMTESAVKILDDPNINNKRGAKYVLKAVGNPVHTMADGIKVHKMYSNEFKGSSYNVAKTTSKITGKMRCFCRGEWRYCSAEEEFKYNDEINLSQTKNIDDKCFSAANTWGFCGMIHKADNKFRILIKNEKGRANTGRECMSRLKSQLIKLLQDIKFKPPIDNEIKKLSRNQLCKKIKEATISKNLKENLKEKSNKELKYLYIFSDVKKNILCGWLHEILQQKGFLFKF